MKARELRIGNYYNQFGNIHQANGTVISQLEIAPKDQLWCKPIPLTEEWLLRFGFEKNKKGRFKVLKHSAVPILFNDDFNGWTCDGINFSINHTLYVHQLQNLIHALTGEELTLTKS